jgi:hypothetical protein
MPIDLTTAEQVRVAEIVAGAADEEAGLELTLQKLEDNEAQEIQDDGIYAKFLADYRTDVILARLATVKSSLDSSLPAFAPHYINASRYGADTTNEFPLASPVGAHPDYPVPPSWPNSFPIALFEDFRIWRPPNGDIDVGGIFYGPGPPIGTRITDAGQPGGYGFASGEEILFTSGAEAGNNYSIIAIETIGSANDTIVVSPNLTGTLLAGDDFVIVDSALNALFGAGNSIVVYQADPPVGFQITDPDDAEVQAAIDSGDAIAFMRFDEKTGTYIGQTTRGDQVTFFEELKENTEGRNDAFAAEIGTP